MTQLKMTESTSKYRVPQIDIAKAILIVLVVIGHTHFTYSKYIYWFHMPCFFIISGYLLKPKQDIRIFIKKRALTYFMPLFLFGSIDLLIKNNLTIRGFLQLLYNGRIIGGVYWFVPCLFLGSLIVLVVDKFCKKYKIIVHIALFIISILYSKYIIPHDSTQYPYYLCFPWNVDVSLLAAFFIALGVYLNKISYFDNYKPSHLIVSILILCVFFVIDFWGIADFRLDMKYSVYENFLFITLIPLCSFVLLFQFSKLLSKLDYLSVFLSLVGKSSMIVMYIHLILKDHFIIPFFGEKYSILIYLFFTISISLILYFLVSVVKKYIVSYKVPV